MINKQTGTIQVAENFGESETNPHYHASNLITTKYVGKNHPSIEYKTKGDAYYLKNGDQWYFRPNGAEDFYRVKWFNLDCNVDVGYLDVAVYEGLNRNIYGKKGEVRVTANYDFIFTTMVEGEREDFKLNGLDTVKLKSLS